MAFPIYLKNKNDINLCITIPEYSINAMEDRFAMLENFGYNCQSRLLQVVILGTTKVLKQKFAKCTSFQTIETIAREEIPLLFVNFTVDKMRFQKKFLTSEV